MKSLGRILYVAPHALGDLVMSLPAIRLLVEAGCNVTLLVKGSAEKEYFELASGLENCTVLVLDEYRKFGAIAGNLLLVLKLLSFRLLSSK